MLVKDCYPPTRKCSAVVTALINHLYYNSMYHIYHVPHRVLCNDVRTHDESPYMYV